MDVVQKEETFQLRGLSTTRLDTFIDAAFAFGSTVLLLSSGELPSTYPEFVTLIKDIPSFTLSFFTMMIFWLSHRAWSRSYGLENNWTIFFSLLLVLTLLVYVYPLKMMYSSLFNFMGSGGLPAAIQLTSLQEVATMIGVYGIGFVTLSFSIWGLYLTSWNARELLNLSAHERQQTVSHIAVWSTLLATGILSASIALLAPPQIGVMAGFCYWLLAPGIPLVRWTLKRRSGKSTAA